MAGPKERASINFPISTWRRFGAGLQTPPCAGPQVSRRGFGPETYGQASGKVGRPCHNLVLSCEDSGKLFLARSLALAKELRRIAPQLRLHGISVVFERNREKRLITLTKTNRPENLPSRLSNNLIGRCFSDTFDEEKFPET